MLFRGSRRGVSRHKSSISSRSSNGNPVGRQLRRPVTPQEKEMLQSDIESTDQAIDRLFYGLYGLTEADIKIVEEK